MGLSRPGKAPEVGWGAPCAAQAWAPPPTAPPPCPASSELTAQSTRTANSLGLRRLLEALFRVGKISLCAVHVRATRSPRGLRADTPLHPAQACERCRAGRASPGLGAGPSTLIAAWAADARAAGLQQAPTGSFKPINSECGPHLQGRPLFPTAEFREMLGLNVFSKNSSQAGKGWQEPDEWGWAETMPRAAKWWRRLGKRRRPWNTDVSPGRGRQQSRPNSIITRGRRRTQGLQCALGWLKDKTSSHRNQKNF